MCEMLILCVDLEPWEISMQKILSETVSYMCVCVTEMKIKYAWFL